MAEFVNTVDVLGDDAVSTALIEKTLTTFYDNVITTVGRNGLAHLPNLTDVKLPLAEDTGRSGFYGDKALKQVDLTSVLNISEYSFYGCSALTALILRGSTVCTLESTNALTGTPITSGTGYIYVPRALVDSYKAATNWSTYSAQFRALEDFTVDGTVTGELDETKIAA